MEQSFETHYQPGDSVTCLVTAEELGGYLVTIIPSQLPGFLPSKETIAIGKIVAAAFVCMSGKKALLTYPGNLATKPAKPPELKEPDFAVFDGLNLNQQPRVQRAIDLIIPPFAALPIHKKLTPDDADRLIAKLDREAFTGCLKVDSQAQRSRSAVIFYQGRAVGAIYGKKSLHEPYRIETSLMLMLEDLRHTATEVDYYVLPEELVLSLASLFLGVMTERPYGFTNKEYAENILSDFRLRKQTGCLVLQQQLPCGLAFIHQGKFTGAYAVEDRMYVPDEFWLTGLISKFPAARVEAYLLPDMLMSNATLFGYRLTSAPFSLKATDF